MADNAFIFDFKGEDTIKIPEMEMKDIKNIIFKDIVIGFLIWCFGPLLFVATAVSVPDSWFYILEYKCTKSASFLRHIDCFDLSKNLSCVCTCLNRFGGTYCANKKK